MFGRLQRKRNSTKQPIDQGSSRIADNTASIPTPSSTPTKLFSPIAQPTGALHPATLTPVSATPSHNHSLTRTSPKRQLNAYSHRPLPPPLDLALPLPPPIPSYGPYLARPLPSHTPGRPRDTATSHGRLRGLADAALMDVDSRGSEVSADRRLPHPLGLRPAYVSHGGFWGEQRAVKDRSASSSSSRYSPYPSLPAIPPYRNADVAQELPPFLPASAPTSRQASPSRQQSAIPSSYSLPPLKSKSTKDKPHTNQQGPARRSHPLENIHLDREYRQQSVDTWEAQAMRVLRLPKIPPSAALTSRVTASAACPAISNDTAEQPPRSPPATAVGPPQLPVPTPRLQREHVKRSRQALADARQPTPPTTATEVLPSSAASMEASLLSARECFQVPSTSDLSAPLGYPLPPSPPATQPALTRPRRGSDKRPRATPHSSAWASAASHVAPHDSLGKRVHPPPGGIIPPPPSVSRRGGQGPLLACSSSKTITLAPHPEKHAEDHRPARTFDLTAAHPHLLTMRKTISEPGTLPEPSSGQSSTFRAKSVPPPSSPPTDFLPSPFLAASTTSSLAKRKRHPPHLTLSTRLRPLLPRPAETTAFAVHTARRRASTRPQSASDLTRIESRSGSGSAKDSDFESMSSSLLTGGSGVSSPAAQRKLVEKNGPESQDTQVTLVGSSQSASAGASTSALGAISCLPKLGEMPGEVAVEERRGGEGDVGGEGCGKGVTHRTRGKDRVKEGRREKQVDDADERSNKRKRFERMRQALDDAASLNHSLQLEAADFRRRIEQLEAELARAGVSREGRAPGIARSDNGYAQGKAGHGSEGGFGGSRGVDEQIRGESTR